MFINFYSVSTVSNLSNMLQCILLLPSDCVYVHYCNKIISSPIKGANRPLRGGETSRWRNVQGAKRPGGETVESVMMETDKNIYFDKQNNNMATSIIPTQERQSVSK